MRISNTIVWLVSAAAPVLGLPGKPGGHGGHPEPSQPAWVHPGVMLDAAELAFMKDKVRCREEPWASANAHMMTSSLANLSRTAAPVDVVQCGSYSKPDVGCSAERADAIAAYTLSLAWTITGQRRYAQKAIEYMDAWSAIMTGHNDSNAPLQAGWVGSVWARTGEIIRYSHAGWSEKGISQFKGMLKTAYLPAVIVGSQYNGNWELVMMEAAMFISVFLEDTTSYDAAMAKFLLRVPAYIYLSTDGAYPVSPNGSVYTTAAKLKSYWQGQGTYVDGLSQETCRDLEHTGYGIASISHVSAMSRIQGRDLFVEDTGTRLRAATEFHTNYALGAAVPSWLCGGTLKGGLINVTEIAHTELVGRLHYSMPNTTAYTYKQRPGGENELFVAWETLTHGRK